MFCSWVIWVWVDEEVRFFVRIGRFSVGLEVLLLILDLDMVGREVEDVLVGLGNYWGLWVVCWLF